PGRDETTIGWTDSLVIGVAQALALLPGVSRSGSTIAFGMFRGLSRVAAARFSFLLAIPAVIGATLLKLPDLFSGDTGGFSDSEVVVGMIAAALSGYWAIRYLLRFVATDELTGFARYLIFFAALVVVASLWIGPPSSV
ncbi:MAG: undecaprenyl-diphosphatase, partial [Actinomycetota bacterium]|nr:undecaprenyl-diphosphatase [Actinomycetota bacterium]